MMSRLGLLVMIGLAAAPATVRADEGRQSVDDAWWTGPLLAAGANTVPRGHLYLEPYLFDAMVRGHFDGSGQRRGVPHEHDFGSQSYVVYGLFDDVHVGLIPRVGFHDPAEGPSSSSVGIGDLGLLGQIRLTRFDEARGIPATALVVQETLPTGTYDRLGDRTADGLGGGAYTTSIALYAQHVFWLPTGRILRARLDLTYAFSASASVDDVSVYGTGAGFHGRAHPGQTFVANAAWEYSLTRSWVVAMDLVYEHDGRTSVRGVGPPQDGASDAEGMPIELAAPPGWSIAVAPAVEYNLSSRVGIIAGAKLMLAGHNATDAIIPVMAFQLFL